MRVSFLNKRKEERKNWVPLPQCPLTALSSLSKGGDCEIFFPLRLGVSWCDLCRSSTGSLAVESPWKRHRCPFRKALSHSSNADPCPTSLPPMLCCSLDFCLIFFFKDVSPYDLKPTILPQPTKCWDCRYAPPWLALFAFIIKTWIFSIVHYIKVSFKFIHTLQSCQRKHELWPLTIRVVRFSGDLIYIYLKTVSQSEAQKENQASWPRSTWTQNQSAPLGPSTEWPAIGIIHA